MAGQTMADRWRSLSIMAINKVFEDLEMDAGGTGAQPAHSWRPPTDVFECARVYVIVMEISGLTSAPDGKLLDAEVAVEGDTMIIRGERRERCAHAKNTFHQMEVNYGPFERRVRFHAPFDADGIEAKYRDGFLEVVVPKAAKARRDAQRVEVRS